MGLGKFRRTRENNTGKNATPTPRRIVVTMNAIASRFQVAENIFGIKRNVGESDNCPSAAELNAELLYSCRGVIGLCQPIIRAPQSHSRNVLRVSDIGTLKVSKVGISESAKQSFQRGF